MALNFKGFELCYIYLQACCTMNLALSQATPSFYLVAMEKSHQLRDKIWKWPVSKATITSYEHLGMLLDLLYCIICAEIPTLTHFA